MVRNSKGLSKKQSGPSKKDKKSGNTWILKPNEALSCVFLITFAKEYIE